MPLHVLIVGAGIAGLCCAISLGRQGHKVDIFEKSSFANEIGAAYHTGPYAVKILRQWGFDIKAMRAVVVESWEDRDCEAPEKVLRTVFHLEEKKKELGIDPSLDEIMHHRVDAHRAFKQFALSMPNVKLHLSAGAVHADAETGTLRLSNGGEHSGDVIIGADGIHSRMVECVDPDVGEKYATGVNMYRFMVPTDKAMTDPDLAKILETIDFPRRQAAFVNTKNHRFLVLYSCRDGTLLNCATFQSAKDDLVSLPEGDYNSRGSVEEVLHVMEGWPKGYLALTRMAEDIKHWAVINRDVPASSVRGRLALIGDAAHAIQPTWAAGANMAIEDAGVLGVVLDSEAESQDVTARLKLFNELRYQRTTTVKYASEMRDLKSSVLRLGATERLQARIPGATLPDDILRYLWTFDALSNAEAAMSKLKNDSSDNKAT